jgi:hypothetical protein
MPFVTIGFTNLATNVSKKDQGKSMRGEWQISSLASLIS